MPSQINVINPLEYPHWDDLAMMSGQCSFFHSSAWIKVLYESYRYKPFFFIISNGDHLSTVVPFMEVNSFLTGRRAVSLPFSDYCEPILENNCANSEILKVILEHADAKGWKYIELRGGSCMFPGQEASSFYYGHRLTLCQDEKSMLRAFRDSTRRNIKKAVKNSVRVEANNSKSSLAEYYRLHCITRKHHCLPPQPFDFFKKVYSHIIANNQGNIFLALYKDKIIAADICMHFGSRATYKYGASDRSFQHLRASNLVMWEMIKHYASRGFTTLDLGRTEPGNTGLIQFKNGWGCEQYIIPYYRYDIRRDALICSNGRHGKRFGRILRLAPLPVLRTLGRLLYRHMG